MNELLLLVEQDGFGGKLQVIQPDQHVGLLSGKAVRYCTQKSPVGVKHGFDLGIKCSFSFSLNAGKKSSPAFDNRLLQVHNRFWLFPTCLAHDRHQPIQTVNVRSPDDSRPVPSCAIQRSLTRFFSLHKIILVLIQSGQVGEGGRIRWVVVSECTARKPQSQFRFFSASSRCPEFLIQGCQVLKENGKLGIVLSGHLAVNINRPA